MNVDLLLPFIVINFYQTLSCVNYLWVACHLKPLIIKANKKYALCVCVCVCVCNSPIEGQYELALLLDFFSEWWSHKHWTRHSIYESGMLEIPHTNKHTRYMYILVPLSKYIALLLITINPTQPSCLCLFVCCCCF